MTRIMFKLLRAELHETSPNDFLTAEEKELLKDPQTVKQLYSLSLPQDLAHMVGAALSRMNLPKDPEAAGIFRYAQIFAIQRYENIMWELKALQSFFEEIGVKYIPLKGTVLRQFYPKPEQRTSCDIDLLIVPDDLEKTTEALSEKLNYKKIHEGGHDVGFISPSGVSLELHYTLIEKNDYPEIAGILETVWEHTEPDSLYPHCLRMSREYEYFYHVAHMVKHYLYGGCGIRTFMDLWIYRHRCPELDREKATKLLEKGGIRIFDENAGFLSEMWFSGIEPEKKRKALLEQMEMYVLGGGIYGNTENRVKIQRTEKKSLQYIRSRLILPYDRMKYEFPILREHPILLPVCHVRRWMRLLSGSTSKRIANELKINSTVTAKDSAEVQYMLDALGLR